MYELHANEQYFFDQPTLEHLAEFVRQFPQPCCLSAPLLGQTLVKQNVQVRILDIDKRFASLPGFRYYNIYRPEWLGEEFGLIICDPPFFNISLSQLFSAIRILAGYNYTQPLLVSYLTRRAVNLIGTFAPFNLTPTGYFPAYQTVQASSRNKIEFFGNLGENITKKLRELNLPPFGGDPPFRGD